MTALDSIRPDAQILDAQGYDWAWAYVVFRPITAFPHYLVGSDGGVWSCRTRGGRFVPWTQMTPVFTGHHPHMRHHVGLRRDGRLFLRSVHSLVLTAFIGPRPDGKEACHNDGNPYRNHIVNLRWDTHVSNMKDRKSHGRQLDGEKNHFVKLCVSQVSEIRRRCDAGEQQKIVARDYGIHASCVQKIISRESWKQIP